MRKLKINMVIWSHLSDVQHLMCAGHIEEATKKINFVKLLTDKLDSGIRFMEEKELNEMFKGLKD
jgi:hypothetical protein